MPLARSEHWPGDLQLRTPVQADQQALVGMGQDGPVLPAPWRAGLVLGPALEPNYLVDFQFHAKPRRRKEAPALLIMPGLIRHPRSSWAAAGNSVRTKPRRQKEAERGVEASVAVKSDSIHLFRAARGGRGSININWHCLRVTDSSSRE